MSDDVTDHEYNPLYEADEYEGNYQKSQIERVRRYLIDHCASESKNKLEVEIKRKCGILTYEVVDYYLYEKKPENFNESLTSLSNSNSFENNPFIHKILNIDEDDLIFPNGSNSTTNNSNGKNDDTSLNQRQLSSSSETTIASSSQISESKLANNFSLYQKNNLLVPDEDIKRLNHELKMMHGCDLKFCPKNLPIKDHINQEDINNTVYVCDFCSKTVSLKQNMMEHLTQENHSSASEYILEPKRNDLTSASSQSSSYESFLIENAKRKIKYLKKRSSIKNLNALAGIQVGVFCPSCHFYFSNSTLAAALHYKYCHSPTKDDEIYALAELDRSVKVELEKAHSCFTCKSKYKKLSDLITHFKNTTHFPTNQTDEINVYICPFDNCQFRSTKFFSFKNHIVGHSFFNNNRSEDLKIEVVINIYKIPKYYYHITEFKETDQSESNKLNELEAIESLLDLTKNHPDTSELYKKVRERKNKIHKYQDKDNF